MEVFLSFSGVLVLVPNYPVVNILLTSYIFICVSHEVHAITNVMAAVLVPEQNFKVVFRNTLLFILLLIPIAVNDGMF